MAPYSSTCGPSSSFHEGSEKRGNKRSTRHEDTVADGALTDLQREVLRLFFELPESKGFILAGGAALVASGLSERPTRDVDLFGSDLDAGVASASDALESTCRVRGWTIQRIQDSPTFRRLVIRAVDEELLVDLAVDTPPMNTPTITAFGPTYPLEELAARKLLALFDRAAARDFVDMHTLSSRFDLDRITEVAAQLDDGFDRNVLVEMLGSLRRFSDQDLADLGADPPTLRSFMHAWGAALSGGQFLGKTS